MNASKFWSYVLEKETLAFSSVLAWKWPKIQALKMWSNRVNQNIFITNQVRLKRDREDIMKIIRRIAYWNKTSFSEDITIQPPPEDFNKNPSVMDIFRERRLALISCALGYTWMTNSMVINLFGFGVLISEIEMAFIRIT